MRSKITVIAPSSTANLGPGFDVFGLAVNAFYDEITLTKIKEKKVRIVTEDNIPTNPDKNTAGLVVKNMIKKFKTKDGIEIKIKKNVPARITSYNVCYTKLLRRCKNCIKNQENCECDCRAK